MVTQYVYDIFKDIKNAMVTHKVMEYYENTPPGKQSIKFNTVFDVKMNFLRNEAMLVTGGLMT